MRAYLILPHTDILTQAEALLGHWQQKGADLPAVQALTPATETSLLMVVQHILTETGEINSDYQNVREVLGGAIFLQFGMATGESHNRAGVTGQQL